MNIPVRLWIVDDGVASLGLTAALHATIEKRLGLRPEHSYGRWIFVAPPDARPVVLRVLAELVEDEGYVVLVGEQVASSPGNSLRPPPPALTLDEMFEDAAAEMIATGRR